MTSFNQNDPIIPLVVDSDYAVLIVKNSKGGGYCHVKVDFEDYRRCAKYRWRYTSQGYIVAGSQIGGKDGYSFTVTLQAYVARGYRSLQDFEVHQGTDRRLRRVYPINGDKFDCRKANLVDGWRIAACAANYLKERDLPHGVRLNLWNRDGKPYRATVHVGRQEHWLGDFASPEEAATAYQEAIPKYFPAGLPSR